MLCTDNVEKVKSRLHFLASTELGHFFAKITITTNSPCTTVRFHELFRWKSWVIFLDCLLCSLSNNFFSIVFYLFLSITPIPLIEVSSIALAKSRTCRAAHPHDLSRLQTHAAQEVTRLQLQIILQLDLIKLPRDDTASSQHYVTKDTCHSQSRCCSCVREGHRGNIPQSWTFVY